MAVVAGFGPLEAFIGAEEGVALIDVNGKYWSSIEQRGMEPLSLGQALLIGLNPLYPVLYLMNGGFRSAIKQKEIYSIECCKETKDPWYKFLLEKVGDHKVRMRDLRGVYLGQVHDIDFIAAAKNCQDIFCEFEVFSKNEKILFKADNGKFLSLIDRGDLNIKAAKDGPDKYCEFTPTIGDIVSPKFEIISVDFMNVHELILTPTVVQKETYINRSSVEQKHKFNMSWTKTESATTTWNHAWGLDATVSFDCLFAKAEVSVSYLGSYGTSSTKETSITMGEETEVTIPPRKKVTANLIVSKQEDRDIPFTAKIKKIKSNGEVKEFMEQGTWKGMIYENVNVEVEEEDL